MEPTSTKRRGRAARKKATNLSIDGALLDQARKLGINLSQALEETLRARIRQDRQRQWLEQNRSAIDEYNRRIGKQGVFSQGLRSF